MATKPLARESTTSLRLTADDKRVLRALMAATGGTSFAAVIRLAVRESLATRTPVAVGRASHSAMLDHKHTAPERR